MTSEPPRTEPFTVEELREMLDRGDSHNTVFTRAYNKNGWGRAKAREEIFGANY